MISERPRGAGLGDGLLGAPDRAGDQHERTGRPGGCRLHREVEHALVETGLADRELGRVDAHRKAARAGVEVVAGQRPLPAHVELPARVQRQRVSRDDGAGAEHREHVLRDLAPVHRRLPG